MSLRIAAQHLAAHGRNGDSQLVHMTPGEVRSLQDLAKAHGGSLTTNPHTGLPEANWLSSLLPAAAGATLTYAFPELGALQAAGIVGGTTALASGNLTQGLMAGLGAYGGAGLTAGVTPSMMTSEMGGTTANVATTEAEKEAAKAAAKEAMLKQAAEKQAMRDQVLGPRPIGADFEQGPQQGPFGDAEFTPRPGLTPETYGQGLPTGPTSASLKPEMGLMDTLKKNATFRNLGMAAAPLLADSGSRRTPSAPVADTSTAPKYTYERGEDTSKFTPDPQGRMRNYFPGAKYTAAAAGGHIQGYNGGGVPGAIESMSIANSLGQNTGYPQANISKGAYATPWQTPISRNMLEGAADTGVNPISGEMNFAAGGLPAPKVEVADRNPMQKPKGLWDMDGITNTAGLYASGGLSDLGSYSDGGRLLRGPGDGVSDSIPAVIGHKQPARLADGEFVVPARIVSEIGNGSTEAGARKLYAMMDRVQKARGKTVGKGKVAKNTRADKYLPA